MLKPYRKSALRVKLALEFVLDMTKNVPKNRTVLQRALRQFAAEKHENDMLKSDELIAAYRELVLQKKIVKSYAIETLLRKRAVRSESGVSTVAILTKSLPCPGKCIYCPSPKGMPKSYLPNEPAVLRAIRAKFAPKKQILSRIQALEATGHDVSKVEVIVMGGTWSHHRKNYQTNYIREIFAGLNGTKHAHSLAVEQKKNESARYRCIGLTLETRPDYITPDELQRMRSFGCTRVEIGVQCIDDEIHKICKRGHGVAEIIKATQLLRSAGFKITYHLMLNLPGSNPKKDLEMFREIFANPDYCPDYLKIYPCVLTADSELEQWYENGTWKPYSEETLSQLIIDCKKYVPEWCRVIRVIRDIPSDSILAGSQTSNLRQVLQRQGMQCRCIRCREIRDEVPQKLVLVKREYEASGGKEIFLSYEDPTLDKIVALCRLRVNDGNEKIYKTLEGAAIIRELHVYGTQVPVGDKSTKQQSQGLGKKLLIEAERLARKAGHKKIAVISGVGVRDYYRHQGYTLRESYMVKTL